MTFYTLRSDKIRVLDLQMYLAGILSRVVGK